jgi:adenine-specific DNA-methyltransferase
VGWWRLNKVARARKKAALKVDATVHRKAERTNIPTAELEAFVRDNEREPETRLYPRDPSLDPQLVWKGKDEQDRKPLAVPSVPIYIQEKISPQALIEDLRSEKKRIADQQQIDLFADFNGLEFKQLVEFYQHSQHWTNRMILGDSLVVMASLAEKEGLKGKVQMIYMDPPYGIKFGSNWQVSTRKRDVKDGKAEDATRQPEQVRAFRDTWELGVNSYLSYLRDRLVAARDLLSESGSIFVQIGDQNVHLVRAVLDEVFGSDNFCSELVFLKTSSANSPVARVNVVATVSDYIVWYALNREELKYRQLYRAKELGGVGGGQYTWRETSSGARGRTGTTNDSEQEESGARIFRPDQLVSQGFGQTTTFPFEFEGREFHPAGGHWKTTRAGMEKLQMANRLMAVGNTLCYVRYLDDFPVFPMTNVWDDTVTSGFGDPKLYVVQTNTKVVERCLLMATDPGDLVLDPTCGSGTTAYVAEHWGRRWITVDTSRVALALARQRMMASRFPYLRLSQSQPAVDGLQTNDSPANRDVSRGFIYETVPHITLKSIANNPDIEEGMNRDEIRAAISRYADSETLFDKAKVDPAIVRVTGPFTVESLSPHRMAADGDHGNSAGPRTEKGVTAFLDRIIDHLRKAGVQNTVKQQRLSFDRLDPWPGGVYIQAAGDYTENGITHTAAVCIGPEYGTVGPELVRDAAKEAVKFADLLIVCGFAFDPHVGEESDQLGRLTILKARMNPDLSMGDELLKKTGAANLFMVFGEPDIKIEDAPENQVVVEIRGLDIYDPTTGAIRSHSVDDIACWFIDTEYNGESFFVRHAYFLGADDPYDKLKRALKAEIDEATWATLYSSRSRPFARPETGRIAVKVINHYGDEVLKVVEVKP